MGSQKCEPLGCFIHVQFPDGDSARVWADFDTRSDVNVVNFAAAQEWKSKHQLCWGSSKGWYKVMGGGKVAPEGSIVLPVQVASRDVNFRIPRRLHLDLSCEIMEAPASVVLGLPTLMETGLLKAVLTDSTEGFPDIDDYDGVDEWCSEMPEGVVMPEIRGTESERKQIQAICMEFAEVFGPAPFGGSKLSPLSIKLEESALEGYRPDRARPVSPAVLEDIRFDLDVRMQNGWLQKGTGRFASAIVAAKQPGKSRRRICGDYRKINKMTVPEAFPCKNAKKVIERLQGSRFFGICDLYKGFYQLPLTPDTSELLGVVTPDGLFQPLCAPFGPKQVPAAFQKRVSEEVLPGLEGNGLESYIDDLCLHSRTFEEFLQNLRELLSRLQKFDLRLNGMKCKLGGSSVDFLGMNVDGDGVRHQESRKQGVKDIQAPKNRKQLKSFLGMGGYFRNHISNFARKVKPLTKLTGKDAKWAWGDDQQRAFEDIKTAMVNVDLLSFIDYSKRVFIRTDASTDGCGAMMFQIQDDIEKPVAYLSKTFNSTERRWSTIEQETYAVYWAITSWESYLLGQHFEVQTDHKNILWLYKSGVPKILRWRLRLQEYDFDVKHLAGSKNVVADGLSRCNGSDSVKTVKWSAGTVADDGFSVDKKLLRMIDAFHNDVHGHQHVRSIEKKMLAAGIQATNLRKHIQYFIKHCPMCQKLDSGSATVPNFATISVKECGEEWSIDTMGPFPPDEDGNTFVLAAVCGFSRFVCLSPAKSTKAEEAAKFVIRLAGFFGFPRFFRSDNGSQYDNELISALLHFAGTERYAAIPYRPQSNGLIERVNREILRHARFIVHERRVKDTWSAYLPLVQRILNASFHSSIGTEPCKIVFGEKVNMNRCLVPSFLSKEVADKIESISDKGRRMYVDNYIRDLTAAQAAIADASVKYQQKVLETRMAKSPATASDEFYRGDWVCASWPHGKKPTKLAVSWKGPYRVKDKKAGTSSVYLCEDPADLVEYEFHISRLRRYNSDLTDDPKALIALDTDEWVVEKIVDHIIPGKKTSEWQFKVRWLDLPEEEDFWLPWFEAKKLTAMDAYAAAHPELHLPLA